MIKKTIRIFGLMILMAALPGTILAQDAKTVLSNVAKAMGAENLRTIQYSGSGSNAGIGQNKNPNMYWPLVRVKSYSREIDLTAPASRVQLVRVQDTGEQTQNQTILPDAPWNSQYDIWLSPHGFLKAGLDAANATLTSQTEFGEEFNVVTLTLQGKYKVQGYINKQNLIARVHTWIDNPVLGDMLVEASYRDYKDFGGVKFPTTIIQKQGGFPTLILIVADVKPNVPINIQPQQQTQAGGGGGTQAVTVQTEKVAEGVFYLKGGTHHSVAVEFADHVAIIEAPQNEQRSLAVIAEVKKQIPNKPIRHLINTHHHFDHSGGLRTYIDAGATIITHDVNKEFYSKTLSAPRTLNPDRLSESRRAPQIETVSDKKILSDATRTLELHLIRGNAHNDGILMAYLPKERILIEADVYTPPNPPGPNAPAAAPSGPPNPNTVNLVENLERLKLDFEKILALHGPGVVTRADLYGAIGKPPSN